jgi:hypothetical protein
MKLLYLVNILVVQKVVNFLEHLKNVKKNHMSKKWTF